MISNPVLKHKSYDLFDEKNDKLLMSFSKALSNPIFLFLDFIMKIINYELLGILLHWFLIALNKCKTQHTIYLGSDLGKNKAA